LQYLQLQNSFLSSPAKTATEIFLVVVRDVSFDSTVIIKLSVSGCLHNYGFLGQSWQIPII